MPAGDGTGPMGMGPMSGRAVGYCAGNPVPGYATPMPGRGLGFGRGRGFGVGRGLGAGFRGGRGRGGWGGGMPYAVAPAAPYVAPAFVPPTASQERDALQSQIEYLEGALDGIRKRMADLETSKSETK